MSFPLFAKHQTFQKSQTADLPISFFKTTAKAGSHLPSNF